MYAAAEEGSSCAVGVGRPSMVLIWTQVCPFLILKRTHQGERRRALECARRERIGSGVTYDCSQAKASWACQSSRPIVRAGQLKILSSTIPKCGVTCDCRQALASWVCQSCPAYGSHRLRLILVLLKIVFQAGANYRPGRLARSGILA